MIKKIHHDRQDYAGVENPAYPGNPVKSCSEQKKEFRTEDL